MVALQTAAVTFGFASTAIAAAGLLPEFWVDFFPQRKRSNSVDPVNTTVFALLFSSLLSGASPMAERPADEVAAELATLKSKYGEVVEKFRGMLTKHKELQVSYNATVQDFEALRTSSAATATEAAELKQQNENLANENSQLLAASLERAAADRQMQETVDGLRAELIAERNAAACARAAAAELQSLHAMQQTASTEEATRCQETLADLEAQIASVREEASQLQHDRDECMAAAVCAKRDLATALLECDGLKLENATLNERLCTVVQAPSVPPTEASSPMLTSAAFTTSEEAPVAISQADAQNSTLAAGTQRMTSTTVSTDEPPSTNEAEQESNEALIAEHASQLQALHLELEDAMKVLRMEGQTREAVLVSQVQEMTLQLTAAQEASRTQQQRMEESYQAQLQALEARSKELEEKHGATLATFKEKTAAAVTRLKQQRDDLQARVTALEASHGECDATIASLRQQVSTLEGMTSSHAADAAQKDASVSHALQEATERDAALKAELLLVQESSAHQVHELQSQLSVALSESASVKQASTEQHAAATAWRTDAAARMERLLEEKANTDALLQEYARRIGELSSERTQGEATLQVAHATSSALEARIVELEARVQEAATLAEQQAEHLNAAQAAQAFQAAPPLGYFPLLRLLLPDSLVGAAAAAAKSEAPTIGEDTGGGGGSSCGDGVNDASHASNSTDATQPLNEWFLVVTAHSPLSQLDASQQVKPQPKPFLQWVSSAQLSKWSAVPTLPFTLPGGEGHTSAQVMESVSKRVLLHSQGSGETEIPPLPIALRGTPTMQSVLRQLLQQREKRQADALAAFEAKCAAAQAQLTTVQEEFAAYKTKASAALKRTAAPSPVPVLVTPATAKSTPSSVKASQGGDHFSFEQVPTEGPGGGGGGDDSAVPVLRQALAASEEARVSADQQVARLAERLRLAHAQVADLTTTVADLKREADETLRRHADQLDAMEVELASRINAALAEREAQRVGDSARQVGALQEELSRCQRQLDSGAERIRALEDALAQRLAAASSPSNHPSAALAFADVDTTGVGGASRFPPASLPHQRSRHDMQVTVTSPPDHSSLSLGKEGRGGGGSTGADAMPPRPPVELASSAATVAGTTGSSASGSVGADSRSQLLLERLLDGADSQPNQTESSTAPLNDSRHQLGSSEGGRERSLVDSLDDYDVLSLQTKLAECLSELADAKSTIDLSEQQLRVLKDTIREQERQIERMGVIGAVPTPQSRPSQHLSFGVQEEEEADGSSGVATTRDTSHSTSALSPGTTTTPVAAAAGGVSHFHTPSGSPSGTPSSDRHSRHFPEPSSRHSASDMGASPSNNTAVNLQYLKNSIVAYMSSSGPEEKRRMLPAISLLLCLSPEEVARISARIGGGEEGLLASAFSLWR